MDMFDKYMQVMYDRDLNVKKVEELEKEVAALGAKIAIAKCDMRVVKTLLEDIQWVWRDSEYDGIGGWVCPCCDQLRQFGHFRGSFHKAPCLLHCVLSRSEDYAT
ncbi:hypothetical protein QE332_gp061 [Pseudomonas phage vB_PaeM_LCK69]|uniref:Uncharacterized protein n=1 Tax=Pseudomonas phage vB_PaeM_LCK69 TaxID=2488595 RepID=A0A3G8F581_9CAUD|nr:hypothetical protein QE332_gp061 [Pseudomonas phage vB_PaeM_LCK69]AZF89672.1 hypothetical protein [Pseudomonas phage vB_PaeM_LCK69]